MVTGIWILAFLVYPSLLSQVALWLGRGSLRRGRFGQARSRFRRALCHDPSQERAALLLIETDLLTGRPEAARSTLISFAAGNAHRRENQAHLSPCAGLLECLTDCLRGHHAAARRHIGDVPVEDAGPDELLAAAQILIVSNDLAAARLILDRFELPPEFNRSPAVAAPARHGPKTQPRGESQPAAASFPVAGPLAGRVALCRAAIYYRASAWEKALSALPSQSALLLSEDAAFCRRLRSSLRQLVSAAPERARA